jgi:excisionase family DNA binding protein
LGLKPAQYFLGLDLNRHFISEPWNQVGALRLRLQPLNVKEFAWIFRVAEDTALKWIREGRVPAFRLGKTVRIDPHLLADMLQREVSDWEAKQELLDRRLKIIEKEGIAENARIDSQ